MVDAGRQALQFELGFPVAEATAQVGGRTARASAARAAGGAVFEIGAGIGPLGVDLADQAYRAHRRRGAARGDEAVEAGGAAPLEVEDGQVVGGCIGDEDVACRVIHRDSGGLLEDRDPWASSSALDGKCSIIGPGMPAASAANWDTPRSPATYAWFSSSTSLAGV